jgi:putative transposase
MIQILKAYKYRIYPTEDQEVLLNKTFGCCRVVWNACTESFICSLSRYFEEQGKEDATEQCGHIAGADNHQ